MKVEKNRLESSGLVETETEARSTRNLSELLYTILRMRITLQDSISSPLGTEESVGSRRTIRPRLLHRKNYALPKFGGILDLAPLTNYQCHVS